MKRTLPQKVKLVPSCVTQIEVEAGQTKQSLPEVNRRVRTSAAMIGLALSMGAHSLLMPRAGDGALAAEPVAGEATSPVPSNYDVAKVSSESEVFSPSAGLSSGVSTIEHTVQEGQTMLQLAQLYGVDVATIANANDITVDAVLKVGQVLKVPTSSQVARTPQTSAQPASTVGVEPEYYGPVADTAVVPTIPATSAGERDFVLKAEQDAALSQLQEKRDSLRDSLAKLKTAKSDASTEKAAQLESQVPSTAESVPSQPTVAAVPSGLENDQTPVVAAVAPVQAAPQASRAEASSVQSEAQTEPSKEVVATVIELPQANSEAGVVGSDSYRVAAGDTLGAIARAHGISQQQLIEANQISDPNLIRAEQVLVIPKSIAAPISTQSYKVASTAVVSSASTLPSVPVIGVDAKVPANTSETAGFAPGSIAALPIPVKPANVSDGMSSPVQQPGVERLEAPAASGHADYVEGLRQEIVKLREKYQATPTAVKVETGEVTKLAATSTLAAPAAPKRVNPEFSSTGGTAPMSASALTRDESKPTRASGSTPAVTRAQPQKVAAAPIGSSNYAPLIPAVGQMVSPDLPPLGSGDAYLPKGTGAFAGYIWPAKGVLTSGYGWRWGRMHKGIDIAAPIGTPIHAAAPGVVTYAGWNSGGYGNLVEITHSDGSVTLYAHNDRILVREGQNVDQGEQIAEMGSTGYSTGPHSHFEVHLPGQGAVNPMAYLGGGEA